MMNLILAATLACPPVSATYGYQQSYGYAAPVYQTRVAYVATPTYSYQQAYTPTYQAPVYNSSLVGDYLRQEQAYAEEAKRSAKFDRLMEILEKQAQAPPPQPQFQAPPPQYATPQYPQAPPKSIPQFQAPPLPAPQYPAQPSQGEVPPPPVAPPKGRPSFGETSASGASFGGVTSMASVLTNRCASCHTGTSDKGGGVKLIEFDGRIADLGAISEEIIDATRSGRMPKGAPRLQPAEMLSLYAGLMGLQGTRVASSGK
jgi:mono/diheme cytochrome c family protein